MIEWLGFFASFIVLVSLLMSSIKLLRWINLFGAILYGIYGILIISYPTIFMNLGIVFINIFYLSKIYKRSEPKELANS